MAGLAELVCDDASPAEELVELRGCGHCVVCRMDTLVITQSRASSPMLLALFSSGIWPQISAELGVVSRLQVGRELVPD